MTTINGLTTLIGRILLAAIFIISGWGKIVDIAETSATIGRSGLPEEFAWPVAFFELIGGLFILAGVFTRATAILLAGFCLITALMFHTNFAEPVQLVMFLKNLAMAGGFLVLASDPANPYSMDHVWAGKAPTELDITPGDASPSES